MNSRTNETDKCGFQSQVSSFVVKLQLFVIWLLPVWCTSHFTYLILQHIFLTTFPHISFWQGFPFFLRQTWTLSSRTLLFCYSQCMDPWTNLLSFRWAPQLVSKTETKTVCSFGLKAVSIFKSIYTDNDSPRFDRQGSQISFFWPPCEPFVLPVPSLLQNHPPIPPVWFSDQMGTLPILK